MPEYMPEIKPASTSVPSSFEANVQPPLEAVLEKAEQDRLQREEERRVREESIGFLEKNRKINDIVEKYLKSYQMLYTKLILNKMNKQDRKQEKALLPNKIISLKEELVTAIIKYQGARIPDKKNHALPSIEVTYQAKLMLAAIEVTYRKANLVIYNDYLKAKMEKIIQRKKLNDNENEINAYAAKHPGFELLRQKIAIADSLRDCFMDDRIAPHCQLSNYIKIHQNNATILNAHSTWKDAGIIKKLLTCLYYAFANAKSALFSKTHTHSLSGAVMKAVNPKDKIDLDPMAVSGSPTVSYDTDIATESKMAP